MYLCFVLANRFVVVAAAVHMWFIFTRVLERQVWVGNCGLVV